MRFAEALLIAALFVSLGACVPGKRKTASAAPAPPKPVAPAPAPPSQPLSVPQTTAELPPPQPVPAEALATGDAPGQPAPPAPANSTRTPGPRPPRRTPSERPVETAVPPPAETAPATPPAAAPERPLVSESLPAAELKRLQDEAHGRKQEVGQILSRTPQRHMRQQKGTVDRINSFLQQADDAERRGDMRQASELAGRALVLARELK